MQTSTAPAQRQQPLATMASSGRAPRVTLASISTTPRSQPFRLLIHGVEKWGKTTLAAGAPGALFICPEEGLPPELAGQAHFPPPDGGEWTWPDIIDAIRALASGTHEYLTLVFDTVDWIEPLIWKYLCERNSWDNIEAPGYGKGYTAALDEWRRFLAELEQLRRAKGMNVILLAHSWIKNFKDPESDGWDRYELKINNKAAGVLKEWVDAVLFAKHEQVAVKEDGKGKKGRSRGVSTGRRMLFTGYTAAFDGGNRFNLPEELEIPPTGGWALLDAAMKEGPLRRVASMRDAIAVRIDELEPADAEKARGALERAGEDGAKLKILDEWVVGRIARAAQKGA